MKNLINYLGQTALILTTLIPLNTNATSIPYCRAERQTVQEPPCYNLPTIYNLPLQIKSPSYIVPEEIEKPSLPRPFNQKEIPKRDLEAISRIS